MANEYIEVRTGLTVTAPDNVELPISSYRLISKAASGGSSKAELVAQAAALGIDVPPKATKAQISKLIDEYAARAVSESEAAREVVPEGVAPGTNTGE